MYFFFPAFFYIFNHFISIVTLPFEQAYFIIG
nr:MAG TPA: hypothetical protein [Caudoviricetes sp.]